SRRCLLPEGAADAIRVPGRDRDGDPEGSAAAPRSARACGHPRSRWNTGSDNARRARSGDAMDIGLKGKIAMVGGASKGLGYAVARALAAEGAAVSIASRDGEAVRKAAETIARETGGR